MTSPLYKLQELLIVFVLYPITLALPYPVSAKIGIGVFGFAYLLFVLIRVEKVKLTIRKGLHWKQFWKRSLFIFVIIAITTTAYVWWKAPENLFLVPRTNFLLFIFILFVYSVLSVWPQELVYRTFFFKRYSQFFPSKASLIVVNAVLFSLAHLFFRSTLVIALTLIGGVLFALTYFKFKSTTLVTIEHALYGNWLFTVGMGQMLGFPGMEQ